MPHLHPIAVHGRMPPVLVNQGAGMGVVAGVVESSNAGLGNWFKNVVGVLVPPLGAYWLGQEGAEQLQGSLAPLEIKEGPPVVRPAAPQSYEALTMPGAWNPIEMFEQTQAVQRVANQSYASGLRTGYQAGSQDPESSQGDVTTLILLAALGLAVGMIVLRSR